MEEQYQYQSKKDKWIDTIGSILIKVFVLMMIFSWVVAFYPPYEKIWYEKTEPVTWQRCAEEKAKYENGEYSFGEYGPHVFAGYPTEGMKTQLKSYEHFLEVMDEPICLEVDASRLKPTGVYKRVYDFSITPSVGSYSKFGRAMRGRTVVTSYNRAPDSAGRLGAFFYRNKAIYAQYYVLSLEERDRMLILINDSAVDIPKKGTVQLPFAASSIMRLDLEEPEMTQLVIAHNLNYNDDYMYFLDASTYWFMFGLDENEFEEFRAMIAVFMLAGGGLGMALIFVYVLFASKENAEEKQ